VELRAYAAGDAQATLAIFLRAVRETARAHYSPEQVAAWAADSGDLDSWAAARTAVHTQLAIINDHVAGFIDLDDHGYIDMMFVDPDFGRQGIASALLASMLTLARQRGLPAVTTFASLTSRPVFERHGFVITGERYFGEGDNAAKTHAMRCVLDGTTPPLGVGV
jgi:putative acetyltransferase